jgi:hypothetical protein
VDSCREGNRTAPIDAFSELSSDTKRGTVCVLLMIVAESEMVMDICGEGDCVSETCFPFASSPRRTGVTVSRPVAVRIDAVIEDVNDARVRSEVGEPVAERDRLRSPCDALTDRVALVGSADGVNVDVCSSVILDTVRVRIDSVMSSVRVNVDVSIIVTVPNVELTEVVGERCRVWLSCRGDHVNVNV